MTSLTTRDSNTSLNQRSKRSITSKFSSFLSSKSSHINAFSIELDEPLRQHGPGETVKGTVVLNVAKPLGVTHVVACLYGYVQVFKNHSKHNAPPRGNSTRVATGQNKRWVSEYYGDGFASLFEEEVVLCGEGRLDPKLYHFRFEIDFPGDLALPSSIDFERGTITYMVSATVTRPSTIAAATSCDRKVFYRENVDIGSLALPKPREVTLRALEQSGKPKSNLKRLTSYERKRTSASSTKSRTNQSSRTVEDADARSQLSASMTSSRSSSASRDRVGSIASEILSSHSRSPKISNSDHEDKNKNISVIVEASRSGCLPGDVVPLTIQVQHTKIIHSPYGVIVTLYRQARVDMHPNLPITSSVKGRDGRFEDYYPRSKTGLGGLSLSAAGSSQVWRKDLSQTLAPFYIDPRTMSTEVKVAVRIPDDVFPTIRNVPGEMISFRYFVEVVIDIHGKLGTADFDLSTTNLLSSGPTTPRGQATEGPDYVSTLLEANYIDTGSIRRGKNALVVECDLTIGTHDSGKAKGKQRATSRNRAWTDSTLHEMPIEPPLSAEVIERNGQDLQQANNGEWYGYDQDGYYYGIDEFGNEYDYPDDGHYNGYDYDGYQYPYHDYDQRYPFSNTQYLDNTVTHTPGSYMPVPLPPLEDESTMSEKEQIRRAEARLLPSQPPAEVEFTASGANDAPTAPTIPDEGRAMLEGMSSQPTHALDSNLPRMVSVSAVDERVSLAMMNRQSDAASLVVSSCDISRVSSPAHVTDKQEHERHHLQAQGSAPQASGGAREYAPSAPSVEDVEAAAILGASDGQHQHIERLTTTGEALPRYERII